jgi:hypothetical protein
MVVQRLIRVGEERKSLLHGFIRIKLPLMDAPVETIQAGKLTRRNPARHDAAPPQKIITLELTTHKIAGQSRMSANTVNARPETIVVADRRNQCGGAGNDHGDDFCASFANLNPATGVTQLKHLSGSLLRSVIGDFADFLKFGTVLEACFRSNEGAGKGNHKCLLVSLTGIYRSAFRDINIRKGRRQYEGRSFTALSLPPRREIKAHRSSESIGKMNFLGRLNDLHVFARGAALR